MRAKNQSIRASMVVASFFYLVLLAPDAPLAGAAGTDLTATQPADPAPPRALANGTIRFTAPEGWDEIAASATDLRAAFVPHDRSLVVSVEILPVDAKIGPESFGAIMRSLRQTRQQRKEKFVENPTAEKDERFLLRIHEKFHTVVKVDDKPTDKIASQLHLYRQVGARIMMITVWSTADSDEELKQAQSAAEDIALSATFGKK